MVKSISVEEALREGYQLIDVRTKEEFEEFHIPGAVNVPLFTGQEKERISRVYYSKGEREARMVALEMVAKRLPDIVKKIRELKEEKGKVALYCWRGGMRSFSVATISNLVGVNVPTVKGGYREFRNFILKRISDICRRVRFVVLYGPTGCGKTRIIRNLKAKGFPVIDLEGLAGHRGSVFGGIGLKQPSQKMFDAYLWRELEANGDRGYIVVEGESRKIGRIHIPEPFWKGMMNGVKVLVKLPIGERAKICLEDYLSATKKPEVYMDALRRIRKHLNPKIYSEIEKLIESREFGKAAVRLMESYYDPLYIRSIPKADEVIDAETVEEAERRLEALLLKLNNPVLT